MTQASDRWQQADEADREILLLMAMAQPPVSLDLVVRVLSRSPVQVLSSLERLSASGVLASFHPEMTGHYRFVEPDFPSALTRCADRALVRRLAKAVAGALEEMEDGPRKWMASAHLHRMTGHPVNPDRLLKSARHCLESGDMETAARHFRLALEALPEACSEAEDKRQYIDAAGGLLSSGGHLLSLPESKELIGRARQYCLDLDDPHGSARFLVQEAHICALEGDHQQAARLADQAWETASDLQERDLRHWVAVLTADFLSWEGRIGEAVERYEQAIGNLEEVKRDPATLRACAVLGWYYGICGQVARGLGLVEKVKEIAATLGHSKTMVWADCMAGLILIEAGRPDEADPILSGLLKRPEADLGLMVLWAAHHAMAYVQYRKGALPECRRHHFLALDYSQRLNWFHHRGPWSLEYLHALEEAGLGHPESSFRTELDRLLSFPDIHMRGAALRRKVQIGLRERQRCPQDLADLDESLDLLERAGARIEAAHTKVLYARLLLDGTEAGRARKLLQEAWNLFSKINDRLFPDDLRHLLTGRSREGFVVDTIVEAANSLSTARTPDALLSRVVNLAMTYTGAERGAFFGLGEGHEIDIGAARNLDPQIVHDPAFEKNAELVAELARNGQDSVIHLRGPDTGEGRSAADPAWGMLVPVVLRDRCLGAIYLDSRHSGPQLTPRELLVLKAIGHQVAVSLDNAKAYQEIASLKDRLSEENRLYKEEKQDLVPFGQIVGQSKAMRDVYRKIGQVAKTDSTVLITGETGAGKELVAREIHATSDRANGPFIPVNAAAFDPNLIASELFGHERGAFTGATAARVGRFELAHAGTLFLDDVDTLPLDVQIKILRVIQEKEFERVGGNRRIRSDFRLIASTNKDLGELMNTGRFRSDLFFRLNVFPIHVPALRHRREDIPRLAIFFLHFFSRLMEKRFQGVSEADMNRLIHYNWPGNVRELRNVIERSVILSPNGFLRIPHLEEETENVAKREEFRTLAEMERAYILEVLEKCHWRISGNKGASRILGLKPSTLYAKMKRLGVARKYA
jgi:transcriptional regulator with GAF, ATPase, and Fis domain/tetratricopeptide (TPR) repeat protein